jgi:hypothetical protein
LPKIESFLLIGASFFFLAKFRSVDLDETITLTARALENLDLVDFENKGRKRREWRCQYLASRSRELMRLPNVYFYETAKPG